MPEKNVKKRFDPTVKIANIISRKSKIRLESKG